MLSSFSRSMRSLEADSPRRPVLALLFATTLILAWTAWLFLARVAVYEVSDRADLQVDRAAHPIEAQFTGRVVSSYMVLDREVKSREVLVELDADAQQLQLKEERVRSTALAPQIGALQSQIQADETAWQRERQAAPVALEESSARVKEADAGARLAEEEAKLQDQLFASGVVSEVDLHRARSAAQERRAAADSLRLGVSRLERQQLTQDSERQAHVQELKTQLVQLKGQRATAGAEIERLQGEVSRRSIRAPVDGRLGEVANLRVGSVVREGEKLGAVVPTGNLRIVANFLPPDALGRIRPGQHARMRLQGFPWVQYGSLSATVTSLANEVRDGRIRVELTVDSNSGSHIPLQHGLPGTVEVKVEETSPAALVLRTAGRLLASPRSTSDSSRPAAESHEGS
ncbi:MAG: HlyD family secretion protein [Acidobacteria bacterium]|nr:MAG: HlyD family secretion protein [Acidobacteriota bacterium]